MVKRKDETWTENRLRKDFSMTQGDWLKLFESQGFGCEICGATEPGRKDGHWCLDHDHKNGKRRGILCNGCNMGLGNIMDDKSKLSEAIEYLERASKRTSDGRNIEDWK